jgi:hypothetical protein
MCMKVWALMFWQQLWWRFMSWLWCCVFQLQDPDISKNNSTFICLTLQMKALQSFQSPGITHPRCHIPKDLNLQQHCWENLKSHILIFTRSWVQLVETHSSNLLNQVTKGLKISGHKWYAGSYYDLTKTSCPVFITYGLSFQTGIMIASTAAVNLKA